MQPGIKLSYHKSSETLQLFPSTHAKETVIDNHRVIPSFSWQDRSWPEYCSKDYSNTWREAYPESQCGFRAGRWTADICCSATLGKVHTANIKLFTTSIDLAKTFLTVSRNGLWKIMLMARMPKYSQQNSTSIPWRDDGLCVRQWGTLIFTNFTQPYVLCRVDRRAPGLQRRYQSQVQNRWSVSKHIHRFMKSEPGIFFFFSQIIVHSNQQQKKACTYRWTILQSLQQQWTYNFQWLQHQCGDNRQKCLSKLCILQIQKQRVRSE